MKIKMDHLCSTCSPLGSQRNHQSHTWHVPRVFRVPHPCLTLTHPAVCLVGWPGGITSPTLWLLCRLGNAEPQREAGRREEGELDSSSFFLPWIHHGPAVSPTRWPPFLSFLAVLSWGWESLLLGPHQSWDSDSSTTALSLVVPHALPTLKTKPPLIILIWGYHVFLWDPDWYFSLKLRLFFFQNGGHILYVVLNIIIFY